MKLRYVLAVVALLAAGGAGASSAKVVDDTQLGLGTSLRGLVALPPDRIAGFGYFDEEDGSLRGFLRVLEVQGDAAATGFVVKDQLIRDHFLHGGLLHDGDLWLAGSGITSKEAGTLRAREAGGGAWVVERVDSLPSASFGGVALGPRGVQTTGVEKADNVASLITRRTFDDGETWRTVDSLIVQKNAMAGGGLGGQGMASSAEAVIVMGAMSSSMDGEPRWIVRRSDDGLSWATSDDVPGLATAISGDPSDPRTFYVAGAQPGEGGVRVSVLRATNDAGRTWKEVDRVNLGGGLSEVHVTPSGRVFWSAFERIGTSGYRMQGVLRTRDSSGTFVDMDGPFEGYVVALTSLRSGGGETLYVARNQSESDRTPRFRWETAAYVLEGGAGGGPPTGSGGDGGGAGGAAVPSVETAAQGCACSAAPPDVALGFAIMILSRRSRRKSHARRRRSPGRCRG